jgi:hypothetical protein
MRRNVFVIVVLCSALFIAGLASAVEKGPVETVKEGCKKELEMYCKDVTPGKGRVVACLYAYEDKLSGRCQYALYDAAAQLDQAVAALTYVANECRDDLKSYCSIIKPGEGRLLQCLDKNKEKVSSRCKQAINDVGLK